MSQISELHSKKIINTRTCWWGRETKWKISYPNGKNQQHSNVKHLLHKQEEEEELIILACCEDIYWIRNIRKTSTTNWVVVNGITDTNTTPFQLGFNAKISEQQRTIWSVPELSNKQTHTKFNFHLWFLLRQDLVLNIDNWSMYQFE